LVENVEAILALDVLESSEVAAKRGAIDCAAALTVIAAGKNLKEVIKAVREYAKCEWYLEDGVKRTARSVRRRERREAAKAARAERRLASRSAPSTVQNPLYSDPRCQNAIKLGTLIDYVSS
jgi:hypothetical protein